MIQLEHLLYKMTEDHNKKQVLYKLKGDQDYVDLDNRYFENAKETILDEIEYQESLKEEINKPL